MRSHNTISRRKLLKLLGAAAPAVLLPKAFLRGQTSALAHINNAKSEGFLHPRKFESGQRLKFNFNIDWKVATGEQDAGQQPQLDDSHWKKVSLPYAWNESDAFKKDIHDLSTGVAWYRKNFKLPASAKGMKIILECEGIRQAGVFYLNGHEIGMSENGIMAFGFDLTPYVKFGDEENVIAARIDNRWDYHEKATNSKFQWSDSNFYANYGGINKNVYLHVLPDVYQTLPLLENLGTTGVYVYADKFSVTNRSAIIHAASQVKNETDQVQRIQYEVILRETDGHPVKQFKGEPVTIQPGATAMLSASSEVTGLSFWSWGYGYLYDVETRLVIDGRTTDTVHTITGFRKTAFSDGMIYLNDRVIQVHGYAQRTTNEWPGIGLSVPAWLSDYSNGLMVEGNANLVRWMHVTPWKQDIESCDRVGLMQAMPAGDSEGDVAGVRWEQRKAVMRQAIVYNRNNPSIIFYECGNKGIREQHMIEMKAIRDEFDPKGGRAIGAREMLDSKTAEYGGEMLYINKSSTKPLWAMEFSRDEGLRKYWDDYTPPFHKDGEGPLYKNEPAGIYNRNMDTHAIENVARWYEYWAVRPGTGTRVSSGGVNIVFADTNTHHRGAVIYRTSGEVDAMRIKKQNFFANQVMWVGWVDIEPDPKGIHIIGHWNYSRGLRKDISVVSTAENVELYLNGRLLSGNSSTARRSHQFLFTFPDVLWEPGELTAKGFDKDKKFLGSYSLKTAGEPAGLRLTAIHHPDGWLADGHDLALVEVEVIDAKGERCPTALHEISFTMESPDLAEWKGGIAVGPDNYIGATTLPVEGGVNRVLIRSTRKAGTLKVLASSGGLKSAHLIIKSREAPIYSGLSTKMPDDGLKGRLSRGATPVGPSFKVSRIGHKIASVTAGANAANAGQSIDDNERTAWENDGLMRTAWIAYTLETPGMIHEIDLKLNGFRTKMYPLIITVDDKVVFKGKTDRNLGYYTAVCKPTHGRVVKIQLAGDLQEGKDFLGEEVNGKKLEDGVASKIADATVRKNTSDGAKGKLSIIEAEIYKRV